VSGVLTPHDIDALFAPLARFSRVALAVSGGGDSVALMLLAREWVRRAPEAPGLVVLTVDHRLRPESRHEAEWVAQQAGAIGLPHHILTWEAAQPGDSQADAREARYTLMAGFAAAHDIGAIVTAHTSDDVAETFLMRLARGSGVDGLAAMASETAWDGVPVLRPMLAVSRDTLRAELDARDAVWLEDPSNVEERFERVRVRRALETLGELGITRARIVESAERLRRAREAIVTAASDFINAYAEVSAAGYVRLPDHALNTLPDDVAIHALKSLLHAIGGRVRAPRLRKLETLAEQLRYGLDASTTLGGCVISPDRGALVICREPGRLHAAPVTLGPGETVIWDRRFRVTCGDLPRPVSIAALGERNLAALPKAVRQQHPAPALAALPAIYADGQLLGVPVPGFALAEQHAAAATCLAAFIWPADGTGHA
jgi:tRNA(Ile)-lysidine synthase